MGKALGAVALGGCLASACVGAPWGQGGAEPTRATAGALIKTLDQAMLARASERLAQGVASRWVEGAALGEVAGVFRIDWRTWLLTPGSPRLELRPATSALQAASSSYTDFGLVAHVPLAAAEHEIELSADFLEAPCSIKVLVAAGELAVPMGLTADKLGRVQGVVLPGAIYRALSDVTPNAILKADLSACVGPVDPGAHLAALGSAFADAAVAAVSDALNAEVPAALGLDLAFGWSAAVNADAAGTGFLRTALRGLASALVRRQAEVVQVAFALTLEADAHPCMGTTSLATPRAELTQAALPPGAALHVESLERMIAASWLVGAACADHLGVIPVASGPLVAAWPALARLGPDALVSLELWPSALPRVKADPDMVDGLVLDTGRMRADIMVSYAGARWRAASVVLELSVAGTLWVDDAGAGAEGQPFGPSAEASAIYFDPAAIEARPTLVEAALLTAPEADAIAALLPPLVEALLLERPLARLPAALSPLGAAEVMVSGDYLSWPTR